LGAAGGPVTGFSRSDPFATGLFDSGINRTDSTGTLDFGIITDHMDVDVLISAIQEQKSAKLLANPRLLVLDNEEASFKAIEEIPYQQLQQGGFESFGTTEFKEVGVELTVTPHLATDGMIRLHIVPVFSVRTDSVINIVTIGSGGAQQTTQQPVIDKRETNTKTLVKDGQTIVIAGMRKQSLLKEVSKVPLLGDIPLIGALFRFEGERNINSELVVFITPSIVPEEGGLTQLEQRQFNRTVLPTVDEPHPRIDPKTKKIKAQPVKSDVE
jgi:type II secretory pathway component GspD/PulD (secretin)